MKAYQHFTLGLTIAVLCALLIKPMIMLLSGQMIQSTQWGAITLCVLIFLPMILLFILKKDIEPISLSVVVVLTLFGASWIWSHLPEPQPQAATIESMSYTPYSDEPSVSVIRSATR